MNEICQNAGIGKSQANTILSVLKHEDVDPFFFQLRKWYLVQIRLETAWYNLRVQDRLNESHTVFILEQDRLTFDPQKTDADVIPYAGMSTWTTHRPGVIVSPQSPELFDHGVRMLGIGHGMAGGRGTPQWGDRTMPTFDVDREEITAFEVNGTYLFQQYFDQDEVFDALKSYYNRDKYRFEIPECDLDKVRQILDRHFHDLQIEDDLHSYCVVKQKDSNYSDILKNSVLIKRRNDHIIFLMKDQLSVEQAIEHGATPLSEADIHAGL